jgi:hypothetical protein
VKYRLLSVISVFVAGLFLIGSLPTSLARSGGRPLQRAALSIGLGLLVDYLLMLTGTSIRLVFVIGAMCSLCGLLALVRTELRVWRPRWSRISVASAIATAGVVYLLAVFYLQILSEPLLAWDARSIWFFHAKMIWVEGALDRAAGWNHPSVKFSNPDYPKLVPAIAAQLAYLKGYWNDFVPKGSLLVLLLPLMMWVFTFARRRLSFVLLALAFLFSLHEWLWNATMDGYLIVYSGAALLLFGRYLADRSDVDLYSAICALGIAMSIKYEALLFVVCFGVAVLLIGWWRGEVGVRHLVPALSNGRAAIVLFLSIGPAAVWTLLKTRWGLQSDLARDPSASLSRLWARSIDGHTLQYLFEALTVRTTAIWVLTALVAGGLIFSLTRRVRLESGALVAATTAVLYFCGLYVVYLTTPATLDFFLQTSATRTMATAGVALLVALFFILSGLEVDRHERRQVDPSALPAPLPLGGGERVGHA